MIKTFLGGMCVFSAALTLPYTQTSAAEIDSYLITKGGLYEQETAGAPTLITKPYSFYSLVEVDDTGSFTNISLKLPSGQSRKLLLSDSAFEFEKSVGTKPAFDKEFAAGSYAFTIDSIDGRTKAALSLSADRYPSVPQIANWTDLQAVESQAPVVVQWNQFQGGTTNDFVFLEVSGPGDGDTVFRTSGLLDSEVLNGTAREVTIPAGVLQTDANYSGRLLFIKKTGVNTNAVPGAIGLAGYFRETSFPINTLDAAPAEGRFQFAASNFSFGETNGSAFITVTRAGSAGNQGVFVVSANGTATLGEDYLGINTFVQFGDGETSKEVGIQVKDDYNREGNETVLLSLASPNGGGVLGGRGNAVLNIVDNEVSGAGVLQFKSINVSVSETSRVAKLTVTRTGGSKGTVGAMFYVDAGTASDDADFISTNGLVQLTTGQTNKVISIPLKDDTFDEPNETFSVALTDLRGGAALGTKSTATVNILDNDVGGVLAFSSANFKVNENEGNAVITVTRSGGKASEVSVEISTAAETATDADFTSTTVVVPFGAKEMSKTVLVPISQDLLAEGNETFTVQLSNPQGGATLGAVSSATVSILDDESSVSLAQAIYTLSETNKSMAFVVTRSGALTTPVSVNFATVNGSAFAGTDFVGTNGVLNFAANVSSKTVIVKLLNDFDVEGNETFAFSLSNPQGGTQLGTITSATATIENDDFPGTIAFGSATFSVAEGSKGSVVVKRTGGLASGVSVLVVTSPGTATVGTDYTAVTTNIVFAGGETSKKISIPTVLDVSPEGTETVNLHLGSVSGGASLGSQSTAVLKINNKPDPNAIPAAGESYMTATITGVGHGLNKTLNIKHNPLKQEVVGAAYVRTGGRIQGLTGSKTIVGAGFPPSVIFHNLQFPFMNASGPTIIQIDSSSSAGGAIWTYTSTGENHAYGTGGPGSSGSVILDVVNPNTKTLAGRFDFIAVQDGGSKKVRIKGSFRVRNVSVSN